MNSASGDRRRIDDHDGSTRLGTLQAFDAGAYTATVLFTGGQGALLTGVPVSRAISAGELVTGRRVAVVFADPVNTADCVLFALW